MNSGGVSEGKGTFAVPAINKAPSLQVGQSEPNGDAANIETAAELVFAGNGKIGRIWITEDFLGKSGGEVGSGS